MNAEWTTRKTATAVTLLNNSLQQVIQICSMLPVRMSITERVNIMVNQSIKVFMEIYLCSEQNMPSRSRVRH